MISEKEKLEYESLPEFIREPYSSIRESYVSSATASKRPVLEERKVDPFLPKTAELEALWPGVNHEFLQPSNKSPSFYLTLGFMAGAVVSLIGVFLFSFFGSGSHGTVHGAKQIVVAGAQGSANMNLKNQISSQSGKSTMHPIVVDGAEVIIPVYSTYEVKTGDTLAGIALKAYKRVSPRMLDAICKANGMRNANVLSLGQKLILPEYRPQYNQSSAMVGQPQ